MLILIFIKFDDLFIVPIKLKTSGLLNTAIVMKVLAYIN